MVTEYFINLIEKSNIFNKIEKNYIYNNVELFSKVYQFATIELLNNSKSKLV